MKILLHGLNYSPEELGIGKYSGEMMQFLASKGHQCEVVTTPPYYPQWEVHDGYHAARYTHEQQPIEGSHETSIDVDRNTAYIGVTRCPLWVPKKVSGLKRIIHLASFGLSSVPVTLWKAIRQRPDVIVTVEPSAFCMPTTWLAARLTGAKAWLHVQDFEVDAAFDLGLIKGRWLRKLVRTVESFLMRRFDRVSSISPNMLAKLLEKGVDEKRVYSFPNWVDCEEMRPLESTKESRDLLRQRFGLPTNKCIALYAGNIGAKQGLEVVVEAARVLSKEANSNIQFVICGQGAAHADISERAKDIDNVLMLPVQPFEKFNELMNCADIHLLPQRADAADLVMPSKLTGMLATGRAVVANAAPGTQIAKVVEGLGIVVPPGDALSFAEAVRNLSENPDYCSALGKIARSFAEAKLSKEAILLNLEAKLEQLLNTSADASIEEIPATPTSPQSAFRTAPNAPHFESMPKDFAESEMLK